VLYSSQLNCILQAIQPVVLFSPRLYSGQAPGVWALRSADARSSRWPTGVCPSFQSPYIRFVYTLYPIFLKRKCNLPLAYYLHVYTMCGRMSNYPGKCLLIRRPRLFISRGRAPIYPPLLPREAGKTCTVCRAGHGMAPVLCTRTCARGQVEQVERSIAREPLNSVAFGGWVPLAHEYLRSFVHHHTCWTS
jgi:hypothetical protein